MDVQGVLRWLMDAKIPVAKALPLISALASAGVKDPADISHVDDTTLKATVTDKLCLKKIRAKVSKGATGATGAGGKRPAPEPSTGGSGKKKAKRPVRDERGDTAPDPPECSFSETELAAMEIRINRSPIMVLWATELAQRLSFDWSESLTVGRAVADWLALQKGAFYGILDAEEQAEKAVEAARAGGDDEDLPTRTMTVMGAELTLRQTEGGWRAVSKGRLVSPKKVNVYLTKAFQMNFGSVRAALRSLALALPEHEAGATPQAMSLYESFRPDVPKGKAGWGESDIFRLRQVMDLRDEVMKETNKVKQEGRQ